MRYLLSLGIILALLIASEPAQAQLDFFKGIFNSSGSPGLSTEDFPLDLVWVSNTFVPDDYAGKALPIAGSALYLTALTPTQNAAALDFDWRVEDSSGAQGGSAAGRGKNTFVFVTESILPRFTHRISVTATNPASGERASRLLDIPLQNPRLILVRERQGAYLPVGPTLLVEAGTETTLVARPFYFTVEKLTGLSFAWLSGKAKIESGEHDNTLTITTERGLAPGTRRTVEVSAKNQNGGGTFPQTAAARVILLTQ